jgi:excinuclease ABC subunit A
VLLDFVDLPADDPLREQRFSEQLACPNDHDLDTDDLEPRSFSFNSPFGACPTCHGLGTRMEVDPELIVPDPDKSIDEGALTPWAAAAVSDYFGRLLGAVADDLGFRPRRRSRSCRRRCSRRCSTVTSSRCTCATRTATAASAPTGRRSRA